MVNMNLKSNEGIAVLRNTIMLLRISYLFPSKDEVNHPEKNVHIKFTLLTIFGSYFPIGILIHLIVNIKRNEPNYIDEDIMMLLSYCGVSYFAFRFFGNVKKLVVICQKLSDFEIFGEPTNFEEKNRFLNKYSIVYFMYHVTLMTLISFGPVLQISRCKEENARLGINEICGMIGRMFMPFDYDFFPVKQIFFAYEFFVTLLIYQNAGFVSYVIFESVEHIVIRLNHLRDVFAETLKIKDPFERRTRFNKAVQYHYAIIELAKMINNCYSPCCMTHLFLTAPVLGATGYRMISLMAIDAISLFIAWIISTCLACTTGQRLQDASEILNVVLYQTEWYNFEKELQRDLMLVMLRARHPIFLAAGPFGNMSYATIVLIGKTSYSYLTVLKQAM